MPIDAAGDEPLVAAANVLVCLAYPETTPTADQTVIRRDEIVAVLLRLKAGSDANWANEPHLVRPIQALVPLSRANAVARLLGREILKAVQAGYVTLALLRAHELAPRMTKNSHGDSINALTNALAETYKSTGPHLRKVWRARRSTAHICAAAALHTERFASQGRQPDLPAFLIETRGLTSFVQLAEGLESKVELNPKVEIPPAGLVRLRLQNQGSTSQRFAT